MGLVVALPQAPIMGKFPPRRVPNSEHRSREYLSPAEVNSMIVADLARICGDLATLVRRLPCVKATIAG